MTARRWISASLIVVGSWCGPGYAQGPLGDPTGRSGEPPPLSEERPKPPPPAPILPPLPPPPPRDRLPSLRIFVRDIRVVGSTVFKPEELAAVTRPYLNRELNADDLEALRVELTRLYVDRGYINSGAVLPDQTVTDGTVTYQIIEGRLTDIEIEGNRWFRPGYLRSRLRLGAGPPLNVNEMQERLQFLLEDQRIRRLNADLRPGLRPGEAVLTATVEERLPYKLWLQVDNYQSPSVGAERGILTLEHQNLTGWGDILTFKYGRSDGLDPMFDIRYALPVTPWDTLLSVQWRKNSFSVVDKAFRDLDIESASEIYTLTLRHPVYRTLNTEVALEVTGEHLSHQTTLLGEPFSLAPGAVNGESVVSAVRTAQEVVHRTQNQVLAFRSRLSWGVDVLDATIHRGDEPDGQFFAWLGQFQAVRRLPFLDTQAILRSDVQLTPDRLLVLEQMAIGGRYSVRGYRENTFVRDNAVVGSLEIRVPVVRNVRWADYLQVAPFFDYGHAWNTREVGPERHSIYSVGVGLRWGLTIPGLVELRPQFEIYWGHALRDIRSAEGGDPQDDGIHFQFVLGVF